MRPARILPVLLLALGLALALAARATAGERSEGTVTGVVRYKGTPPARKPINTASEPACSSQKLTDESVVVNSDGTLRDVHVGFAPGAAGKAAAPTWPVIVHQKGCRYEPHVAGVIAGQPLFVENDDEFMHNVHAMLGGETWFNRSQPRGAPAIQQKDVGKPGEVLELRCDVHSWMKAYVVVSDGPYFDVTGEGGAFTIKNVPKGKTFTLEAWHPTLGKKTKQVKAGDEVEFVFP